MTYTPNCVLIPRFAVEAVVSGDINGDYFASLCLAALDYDEKSDPMREWAQNCLNAGKVVQDKPTGNPIPVRRRGGTAAAPAQIAEVDGELITYFQQQLAARVRSAATLTDPSGVIALAQNRKEVLDACVNFAASFEGSGKQIHSLGGLLARALKDPGPDTLVSRYGSNPSPGDSVLRKISEKFKDALPQTELAAVAEE